MSSPYATSLLQQPVSHPAPQAPVHHRHVTHVVAQPQPMYAPAAAPQQAPAAPRQGGSAVAALALALVVLLLGAVALVGAYYATTQASPSAREAAVVTNVAARHGFRDGRESGIVAGRTDALDFASTTAAMRATIARQQAYNAAYQRGMRAGRKWRAPRYAGGYGGGYRAPRIGGYGGYEVAAAVGQAQNLANITGAPVDVEIY